MFFVVFLRSQSLSRKSILGLATCVAVGSVNLALGASQVSALFVLSFKRS